MPEIKVLDQYTIDKIAAGEVIERPASVVKELVENAIDAKASAVTVEIKDGGTSFIRITDNGAGIVNSQVRTAFLRHSTSKIEQVEDLMSVSSLGFRGEALSSIASVAQVELITKTPEEMAGVRYRIEGGKEKDLEEIGAPSGSTFLIRNLFYNTPARKKFLKSNQTETGYISDLMEKLALSHPEISFKFIINNKIKLHTSGNSNLKEIIYHIYGRQIAANLIPIQFENELFRVEGFIGKPLISRGNRNYETYFINGRYIKSSLLSKGIEEGYKTFMMQHKYPFTVLHFSIDGNLLDINVHPTKMELRFIHQETIYDCISQMIKDAVTKSELIYQVEFVKEKEDKKTFERAKIPEPFEQKRIEKIRQSIQKDTPYTPKYEHRTRPDAKQERPEKPKEETLHYEQQKIPEVVVKEENVYGKKLLLQESRKYHKIIGQLFETYWLVQFEDNLYIIDQHAAHEKVLYEKTMAALKKKEMTTQAVYPPLILTLSMQEEVLFQNYKQYFIDLGFEIEHFGGKEYTVQGVPGNLFGLNAVDILMEVLDSLSTFSGNETPVAVLEKIASMSCKGAVKGNQTLSRTEIEKLIDELLYLENPYHCPHGRPTIISMSKYELEKKFKRIL